MSTDPRDGCPRCVDCYDGWLVSTSLVKRSLAVCGHLSIGQVVLVLGGWGIFALFAACAGALGRVQ
jgi:hypothetical protein